LLGNTDKVVFEEGWIYGGADNGIYYFDF